MKIYTWLQRILFAVMGVVFLIITLGCLYNFSQVDLGDSNNTPVLFAFGVIVALQLFVIIRALFRLVDKIEYDASKKSHYLIPVVCFCIMAVVFIILMCVMQPRPITDSYDDLDTAAWIASHGAVDVDNYHIKYMGAFSNNYTLTLIFAVILKVLPFLQMSGILMVLTLMNAVAILVAIFLMWLILKECVGIRAANKALILCTFNPIYYCLVFWIYSLTFSLPVMMGIVYVAIRIYKCIDIKKKEVLLEIFLGILIVVGYELRPTNVFPVIAMVLALPLVLSKHHVLKKILRSGIVALIAAVVLSVTVSTVKDRYFGEIQDQNYPILYWISMGSHGSGDLVSNGEEKAILEKYETADERSNAFLKRTIDNYKQLGISGTAELWVRKTLTTWADGYSTVHNRMSHGEIQNYLYELIGGTHRQLFYIYCQAYRFLIVLGVVLFCLNGSRKKKGDVLYYIMFLSLAGGIAFYMLWEAKNIYSAAFLLPMIILAQEGIGTLSKNIFTVPQVRERRRFINSLYVLSIVLVSMISFHLYGTEETFNFYRINTMYNSRESTDLEMKEEICQDFYTEKAFNRIVLMADTDEDGKYISDYTISILDSHQQLLFEKTIKPSDIKDRRITVDFNKTQCDNHYYVIIKKNYPVFGDIHFYIRNTYFLDSYKGKLEVDGNKAYVNDLNMDVIYSVEQPYFNQSQKYLFTGFYIVVSLVCFVCMLQEQKTVCRKRQELER